MSPQHKVKLIGGLAAASAVVLSISTGWDTPGWYAVPLLVVAVIAAEVAVVHLSFGRQRWTFSLTEAAIAIAFVHSPHAWAVLAVVLGVTVAQLIRRVEALKMQFNVAQFAAATALGAGFADVVGGGIWGAIGGMGVFWLANNLLIACAVSIMTGQKLLALLWASAPLAAVNSVGTSGLGVLAAWLAINAPFGLLALVIPLLLLWISYDEQTARAAEAQLFAELARLQERASGRSVDVSAQVVLTAAARLFGSDDVEMVLMAGEGPVHYAGDGQGLTRRRVEREALDTPWVLRALGSNGVAVGIENGQPWCTTVLGRPDKPLAVLVARRPVGSVSFGRRESMLADVLKQQAESWLSIAELAASRDEATPHRRWSRCGSPRTGSPGSRPPADRHPCTRSSTSCTPSSVPSPRCWARSPWPPSRISAATPRAPAASRAPGGPPTGRRRECSRRDLRQVPRRLAVRGGRAADARCE
jgi:hypothetical protein